MLSQFFQLATNWPVATSRQVLLRYHSGMNITVFCGSSVGHDPAFTRETRTFGAALAQAGMNLVYGGGRVGLMGVLADAVLEGGGSVIGVIPEFLATAERAHRGITELIEVETMHQRKAMMAELGSAFVALPGGIGTLEELIEIITWKQLNRHQKPCWLLDVSGYWEPLRELFQHAYAAGFVRQEQNDLLSWSEDPHRLVESILTQLDGT